MNYQFCKSLSKGLENNVLYFIYDNWDDFGFKTTFNAKFYNNDKLENWGSIHIAVKYDNEETYPGTYNLLEKSSNIDKTISKLPENSYLMGDIDYYSKLADLCKLENKEDSLTNIIANTNDIVLNSKLRKKIDRYTVYQTSFLRFINESSFNQYTRIANGGAKFVSFNWTLNYTDKKNKIMTSLNISNDYGSVLPSNTFAIIGNNGVGKTTILKDLTVAADNYMQDNIPEKESYFLSDASNFILTSNGTDKENMMGVVNLIFVSYSSFDTFSEKFQAVFNEQGSNSNHIFIGNRKVEEEIQKDTKKYQLNHIIDPSELSSKAIEPLKWVLEKKSDLFSNVISSFTWDTNFMETMESIKELVLNNSSMDSINKIIEKFSSGQKIIYSMLVTLTASAAENSMILIDEPELYLHSPYVISLIDAINSLNKETNSAAILTTHSPDIIQEIPKKNVFIIKQNGSKKNIDNPIMETFGESISAINNTIFGADIRNTGYYKILNQIANTDPEKANELLKNNELGASAAMYLSILSNV